MKQYRHVVTFRRITVFSDSWWGVARALASHFWRYGLRG